MSRIQAVFDELRARGERALVPFVTAGDPDLETTEHLVPAMADAGADLIELGVPFSDPIADGPKIQRASQRALDGGTTLRRVLESVRRIRERTDVPLIAMGYANPYYAMGGAAGFAAAAAAVGLDGVICPDLPPEEGADLYAALADHGVDGILLAAPTTRPERLIHLARETRGFLYYVALTGVTGVGAAVASDLEADVRAAQRAASVPVCVGFGVSTPAQAAEIGRYADGVAVGSAIVERVEAAAGRGECIEAVTGFVSELKAALRVPSSGGS